MWQESTASQSWSILLAPEVEGQSGACFSPAGFYREKPATDGGWPPGSPDPHAHADVTTELLRQEIRRLDGLP